MVSPDPLSPLRCPRCECALKFIGAKSFPEGTLSDLGEVFAGRDAIDLYLCPECGRVEFFAQGVGEEFRRHS
jgi:hypothetical protein